MSKIARRQLLRGAGGFTLALPFLPSIVARPAYGADPIPSLGRYFVCFGSSNGGIREGNIFPGQETLTESREVVRGHAARRGSLVRRLDGSGDAVISKVLRAPESELTERMVRSMNVLRGLDMPFRPGHHWAGFLGNYVKGAVQKPPGEETPTIDQVMAWSPNFYRSLSGVRMRTVHTGQSFGTNGMSFGWANPALREGAIQMVERNLDTKRLFAKLFGAAAPAGAPRPPIVDRVVESYRRLRDGNRRISAGDRQRLEQHMARLAELERELTATSGRGDLAACREPAPLPDGASSLQRLNAMLAMAFMCGYTRLAVVMVDESRLAPRGVWTNWHEQVAHQWWKSDVQEPYIVAGHQQLFQRVLLDLARRLDVEVAPGVSLLDQSLIYWAPECQESTHDQIGIPVVTLGGAGGGLRTGQFCDYRNMNTTATVTFQVKRQVGLTWSRLMATLLQATGVKRAEYEREGVPGYGNPHRDAIYAKVMAPGLFEQSGEPLPFLMG